MKIKKLKNLSEIILINEFVQKTLIYEVGKN